MIQMPTSEPFISNTSCCATKFKIKIMNSTSVRLKNFSPILILPSSSWNKMIKIYLMIGSSKDSCSNLWRFWILEILKLRKLRWILIPLLILFLCTFSEVWLSTRRSHPILTRISIKLTYLVFFSRISISMLRFSSKNASNLSKPKYSSTKNHQHKYT